MLIDLRIHRTFIFVTDISDTRLRISAYRLYRCVMYDRQDWAILARKGIDWLLMK